MSEHYTVIVNIVISAVFGMIVALHESFSPGLDDENTFVSAIHLTFTLNSKHTQKVCFFSFCVACIIPTFGI